MIKYIISIVLFGTSAFAGSVECESHSGDIKTVPFFMYSDVTSISYLDVPDLDFDDCIYDLNVIEKTVSEGLAASLDFEGIDDSKFMGLCMAHAEWYSTFIAIRMDKDYKFHSLAGHIDGDGGYYKLTKSGECK